MAGKGAVLAIRIVSDAKDAAKGFQEAEARVGGFQKNLDRASMAAGGFLAAVGALGRAAQESASRLQQSSGAIATVFGAQTAQIEKAAKDAAKGVGLSTAEYEEQASVMGSMLRNIGVSQDQLAPTVQRLIKIGADLAAVYGGTASEAVDALSSALRGETDPIERYGIGIKQATIDQAMAAAGLDKLTGAAAQQARTQTLLNLITQQAGPALGQWDAQLNTAAESSQVASKEWENAKAALGEALLPVVTAASGALAGLAGWIKENKAVAVPLIAALGGFALAIIAINAAVRAFTVVQTVANAVMAASPLGAALLVMGLIVTVLILLEQKTGAVSAAFRKVGEWMFWAFDHVKSAIAWVVDKVKWFVNNLTVFGWVSKLTGNGDLWEASGPAAGGAAAAYGAAPGAPAPMMFGAAMTAGGGGGSTSSAGLDLQPTTVINISVTGALDPVAVADQIQGLLDRRARNTGRVAVLRAGR